MGTWDRTVFDSFMTTSTEEDEVVHRIGVLDDLERSSGDDVVDVEGASGSVFTAALTDAVSGVDSFTDLSPSLSEALTRPTSPVWIPLTSEPTL